MIAVRSLREANECRAAHQAVSPTKEFFATLRL
jgi:hypothetical protein